VVLLNYEEDVIERRLAGRNWVLMNGRSSASDLKKQRKTKSGIVQDSWNSTNAYG